VKKITTVAAGAVAWKEMQKMIAARAPIVRLDRCHVKPVSDNKRKKKRSYEALIEGYNMHQAISPPRVTVGGVMLENIRFQDDGTAIRGTLSKRPRDRTVVVDYGFTRAEALLKSQ
jgi:hypothetical protein